MRCSGLECGELAAATRAWACCGATGCRRRRLRAGRAACDRDGPEAAGAGLRPAGPSIRTISSPGWPTWDAGETPRRHRPRPMMPMTDPPGLDHHGCGCASMRRWCSPPRRRLAHRASLWRTASTRPISGAASRFAWLSFSAAPAADRTVWRRRSLRRSGRGALRGRARAGERSCGGAPRGPHGDGDIGLTVTSAPETVARLVRHRHAGLPDRGRHRPHLSRVGRADGIGADEIAAHRDGLAMHGPFFWWAGSGSACWSVERDAARLPARYRRARSWTR